MHYFSPLPFSPCLNPAGGFRAPRPNSVLFSRVKSAESGRGVVGGVAWLALWRAFSQTQKLVF